MQRQKKLMSLSVNCEENEYLKRYPGQRRRYLDTNIWIYTWEEYPTFVTDLRELFQSIDAGDLEAVTSELTLAEVLVKPARDGNLELQTLYRLAIQNIGGLHVAPVSREVLSEAAQLSASTNLKLLDAIHATTAILTECSTFLTNDKLFRRVSQLHVVLLSDMNS